MAVTDDSPTGGTETSPDCVVSLLEQAARTVDRMWREAQMDGHHHSSVALGEASYGVHRALIALRTTDAVFDPTLFPTD